MFTVKLEQIWSESLPNQYLPFLRRSKFNPVLSSHWLFTASHSHERRVRMTRTCIIHVRFYVRFCDTRTIRMVSSESLVRVFRTCITTLTLSERRKDCSTSTCLSSESDPVAASTGENNYRVDNVCGRWLRLSSSRSLWVHFNQKRTRKTVAQDECSLMTEVAQDRFYRIRYIGYY